MPDNFVVDVVETDIFGWTPIFREHRFFTFLEDAEKFVKTTNDAGEVGENAMYFIVARPPRQVEATTLPPKPNQ